MNKTDATTRFWAKVNKNAEWSNHVDSRCWDWVGSTTGAGYGNMFIGGSCHTCYAHRLSWEIANGPIPDGLQIAHLCGRRICVNPTHLIACTQSENEGHKIVHGRMNKATGERHPSSKLTEPDVIAILRDHANGFSQRDIAAKFHISRGPVRAIIAGRTWRHIPRPE